MKRALIVKLGAIGDVVMAIPAARALYDAGYSVEWVVGPAAAPLLRLYPWIGVIEADEAALLRGSMTERLRALPGLWKRIAGRYDLCATLYYDPRYRVLTLPVRAARKIMLSKTDRALMPLPGRHHTDEYARILLGRRDDETPFQLPPLRPENLPETPLARVDAQRPRVVLVPAGARNTMRDDALRRWPVENYVELARLLVERGYEVVLSGGPGDTWASAAFAELDVANMIGCCTLVETLALFDAADLVCTHDTGPLHLAGLTSAAIVTLFGPVDPHGRLPQRPNAVALWGGEGFACRPCYDGRDYAACTHNGCIREVTPLDALAQIERLLQARGAGQELAPMVLEMSSARALVSLDAMPQNAKRTYG